MVSITATKKLTKMVIEV